MFRRSHFFLGASLSAFLILTLAGCDASKTTNSNVSNQNKTAVIEKPLERTNIDDLFTLQATTAAADGIDPNTSFSFKSSIELTTEHLKEMLQFTPEIAYAVETVGDNEFEIKPDQPLQKGDIVSATIDLKTSGEDERIDKLLSGDDFSVTQVTGDIEVVIHTEQKPNAEELHTAAALNIQRSYEKTVFSEEDLIKVTIQTTLNSALPETDQSYQVIDMIPAGMRLVTSLRGHSAYPKDNEQARPYHIDRQRISFFVSPSNTSFTYYLRPISQGQFTAEAPIIQSYYFPDMRNSGMEDVITIE
ncbi:MAG: hypothetical protein HYV33_00845 [Candidatus Kerfeldbacteria bacterium]|nr:hypothetical protein [Candidatus Kerfeldbacteria bacterium]